MRPDHCDIRKMDWLICSNDLLVLTQPNSIRRPIGECGSNTIQLTKVCLLLTPWGSPLPEEMFNYARSDTHFLLYVYDNMRNELIDKSNTSVEDGDLVEVVMNRSKEEALQRYERPFYDVQNGLGPMGWSNMLCRTPALFSREQFAVFRAVHQWRDHIARKEDESVHVIMPKHVLYSLAREMPVDMPTLLACSHPISTSFRNHKAEILAVITKARLLGQSGPDLKEHMRTVQPTNGDCFTKVDRAEDFLSALASAKTAHPPQLRLKPGMLAARSRDSLFWGLTVPNNVSRESIAQVPGEGLCLVMPMPRITAEIFEDSKAAGVNGRDWSQASSGAYAEHQYMTNRKHKIDEVFTAKEAVVPRSRRATNPNDPPKAVHPIPESKATDNAQEDPDEVSTASVINKKKHQDQNIVLGVTKEEGSARRVRSKRLKKEEFRRDEAVESQRVREVEPFDYAKAPSLLHAQRDSNPIVTGKGINPYAKSNNTPKGMRKAKEEQEGKSFTFKG